VHFERLAIEAGDATFALELHEAMTVVSGVGRLERDGLVSELIGALSSGRSGVHLEVASDAGSRYAIFRPQGSAHRVVDIDKAADVTRSFTDDAGRVNLLARAGLSEEAARRSMRVTASDLASRSRHDEYLASLAKVDPHRIWDVAGKVMDREERLRRAAEAAGSNPEDAEALETIEQRHREFEAAQAETERVRHISFVVAAGAALLAVPCLVLLGTLAAAPFLLAAIVTTTYSATYWQRLTVARRRESQALAAVGAQSYMTFQINRVNGLLANDHHRRELMQAAEDHRAAMAEWQMAAGDVPVEWALEHRRDVQRAHAALRSKVANANPMALSLPVEDRADHQRVVRDRLEQARHLGAGGETFPVLFDEPLVDLDADEKAELLDVILDAARHQQVIYLTEDEDVARWARQAAAGGRMSLVEPGASPATPTSGSTDAPKRSRHVAA
jgi:hypothetical protein